jgi:hypothetical protein
VTPKKPTKVPQGKAKKKGQIILPKDRLLIDACNRAFQAREDLLKTYKHNARLLFALEIRFGIADIQLAAESLVDSEDDKKCDLVYIDRDEKYAVLAQGTEYQKAGKPSASANKAADLNTATNWYLSVDLQKLPDAIRPAAKELRSAIADGSIETLYVWLVHNAMESANVKSELAVVEGNVDRILRENKWDKTRPEVIEVGESTLAEWYDALKTPIRVSETRKFTIPGGYEMGGDERHARWRAAVTSILLSDLHKAFQKHDADLFTANIRSYLGLREVDGNINSNIRNSALESPADFWVYNNGLTVLVNDYKFGRNQRSISVSGMSVVNGAQTTGVIGNLEAPPPENAMVQVRFVKTRDTDVLRGVVRYNNSQNRITSADFRSNDRVQRRLRSEFEEGFPDLTYTGGRRGGGDDAISRPKNLIPSDTAAQALTAFHGDPALAYFQKGGIWEKDDKYIKVFNDDLTARHLVFVFTLLRSIESTRQSLRDNARIDKLTEDEKTAHLYFIERGAVFLLMTAIGRCMEAFYGKKIVNKFRVSFGNRQNLKNLKATWLPIVQVAVAFAGFLKTATTSGLTSASVNESMAQFSSLVSSTRSSNAQIYAEFAKAVKVS